MTKEQIINFDGMSFDENRRVRLPRSARQWKVRREAKNRLGMARNLKGIFNHFLGS